MLVIELGGDDAAGVDDDHLAVRSGGAASLDGTLDVSLVDGFFPRERDTFEILTAAAGVTGTFAMELLPALLDQLSWNVVYGAGSVVLEVAATALPADYNADGFVDAADYVLWRKTGTPEGYDAWQANFGQKIGSGSVAIANATVPEPAALVTLMFAAAGCCVRRCRTE